MFDIDTNILAPMMDAGVFGENKRPLYQPAGGAPFNVDGVFDNAYLGVVITPDGSPETQTVNPVLGVRLAQFPTPPAGGDKVTVYSVGKTEIFPGVDKTYFVNGVRPDGHGWAKLELTLSA